MKWSIFGPTTDGEERSDLGDTREEEPRMFEGVTSDPPMEWPTEPYETVTDGGHLADDEPIRVVVTDVIEPSNLTDWSPDRYTVGEKPVRIAGGRRNRRFVTITNLGDSVVYLVKNGTMEHWLGAAVPVDAVIRLETNTEVWAVCKPAESAEIGVIQEFTVEDAA